MPRGRNELQLDDTHDLELGQSQKRLRPALQCPDWELNLPYLGRINNRGGNGPPSTGTLKGLRPYEVVHTRDPRIEAHINSTPSRGQSLPLTYA